MSGVMGYKTTVQLCTWRNSACAGTVMWRQTLSSSASARIWYLCPGDCAVEKMKPGGASISCNWQPDTGKIYLGFGGVCRPPPRGSGPNVGEDVSHGQVARGYIHRPTVDSTHMYRGEGEELGEEDGRENGLKKERRSRGQGAK